jgi:regulator of RNase E activity RraB
MKIADIPHDADGDAIRRVLAQGSDVTRPMKVDFYVAVPSEEVGKEIAAAATAKSYDTGLSRDGATGAWTCCCSRMMLLRYDALMRAQQELDALSEPHGGYSDGWGTFGNG